MSLHLTKEQMAALAQHCGHSRATFEQMWHEFVEFRDLVQSSAERLGIPRPSEQFSAFGLAMLDAKTLGELQALDGTVR